ncbi:MAG: pseudouridine synthase [Chitinivibrionales bacterium]|nr:pseudouridine synthase [Chitinivibrionales bacterium]
MNIEQNAGTRIRINRYLAQCGLGSRRACERLVTAGRIYLNGGRVTDLATTIDPALDKIEYKGKELRPLRRLEYVAYHKPPGPVVTRSDPQRRRTIYDDIAESTGRDVGHLRYVGRLDRDSEGLLLLTNDGDLLHALTHPRFHVKKIYHVRIDRPLDARHARTMVEEGVVSAGDRLHAARIVPLDKVAGANAHNWYEVHLFEGKNRQIRRMFEAFAYRIQRLVRVRFASVKLADLPPRVVRPLTEREIQALRNVGYRQAGEG